MQGTQSIERIQRTTPRKVREHGDTRYVAHERREAERTRQEQRAEQRNQKYNAE